MQKRTVRLTLKSQENSGEEANRVSVKIIGLPVRLHQDVMFIYFLAACLMKSDFLFSSNNSSLTASFAALATQLT